MDFNPRVTQAQVLNYRQGFMGVSAVPGSGKTWTLSCLAAELIAAGVLEEDQEILIVTLVNSAVDNFSARVGRFVQEMGLLPNLGYRVRTLHGLCHDIVRERPGLVGLSEDFQIVDERVANEIVKDLVTSLLRQQDYVFDDYFLDDLNENYIANLKHKDLPDYMATLVFNFIKQSKDMSLTPPLLKADLERFGEPLPLLDLCVAAYAEYQRALNYRAVVDFDDLIRLALQALKLDKPFLERLRARWPYILEDEAQDSSLVQEQILRLLAGEDGNWVRVGDPNQAIYETFTTASPKYLRRFVKQQGVDSHNLPESGRSSQSVINLANYLINWTQNDHPVVSLQDALSEPYIRATPPGDPQPNPEDDPCKIYLFEKRFSPEQEIAAVVSSLVRWLPENPESTVAVLVPRNNRGDEIVAALRKQKIEVEELLRSRQSTRNTAGALGNILNYLSDPTSVSKLVTVYKVWRRDDRKDEDIKPRFEWIFKTLRKCPRVEDFLWPRVDRDWLADLEVSEDIDLLGETSVMEHLETFRELVHRWQGAALLPIDQLILTLAQDLFETPSELALAHKLAVVLRQMADSNPTWQLPELTQELVSIAKNERKFLGLGEDDIGFDPDAHKGKVVVTTMHRAKGLEWDRVYMMSVNNYNFPSVQPNDSYISEKWFVRDKLNLQAEILAQLEALHRDPELFDYAEGLATHQARIEYAAERLRLIYVGITRARKELVITWNSGRKKTATPALPFVALQAYWETNQNQ